MKFDVDSIMLWGPPEDIEFLSRITAEIKKRLNDGWTLDKQTATTTTCFHGDLQQNVLRMHVLMIFVKKVE